MEPAYNGKREPLNNRLRGYKAILGRAKVKVDAFHSLRKSCVTNWLDGGVEPHVVQRMAGHSSIETTMKHYAKIDTTRTRWLGAGRSASGASRGS